MTRDLMFKDEIQQLVADAYRGLEEPDGFGTRFYTEEQLAQLPDGARPWMLGVGNPLAHVSCNRARTWWTSAAGPAGTRCSPRPRSHRQVT